MEKITNKFGRKFDADVVVHYMDDAIREAVHDECHETEQAFFDAYCARHAEHFGEDFEFAKRNPVV